MKKNVFALMLLLPVTSHAEEVSNTMEFENAVRDGGDVVLTDDLTISESLNPIYTITRNLTIDGQGHTIDGSEAKNQYLRFMPGSEVNEIKNITFQNLVNQVISDGENGEQLDPDDNQGGMISNFGHIKSIDANFYNNQADFR